MTASVDAELGVVQQPGLELQRLLQAVVVLLARDRPCAAPGNVMNEADGQHDGRCSELELAIRTFLLRILDSHVVNVFE